LRTYTGRYYNAKGFFHMEVKVHGEGLRITIQDLSDVFYDVYHYHYDIFAWDCDRDAESKKYMMPQAQIGLHKFRFESSGTGDIDAVVWAYDGQVPAGERFQKRYLSPAL